MAPAHVCSGSLADVRTARRCRFTPESGQVQCTSSCPLRAKSGPDRTDSARVRSLPMRLLDYVSNFTLWAYNYDLIFSDEEFIRFYLRHLLHYEGRKVVQSGIGWHFVANPNLVRAWNLLDVHVLNIFFYDVALLR